MIFFVFHLQYLYINKFSSNETTLFKLYLEWFLQKQFSTYKLVPTRNNLGIS